MSSTKHENRQTNVNDRWKYMQDMDMQVNDLGGKLLLMDFDYHYLLFGILHVHFVGHSYYWVNPKCFVATMVLEKCWLSLHYQITSDICCRTLPMLAKHPIFLDS